MHKIEITSSYCNYSIAVQTKSTSPTLIHICFRHMKHFYQALIKMDQLGGAVYEGGKLKMEIYTHTYSNRHPLVGVYFRREPDGDIHAPPRH